MHDLLNEQIPSDDGDELADHDFDNVSQTGCNYEDNGKGLQLDVEKILGSGTEEVSQLLNSFLVEIGAKPSAKRFEWALF